MRRLFYASMVVMAVALACRGASAQEGFEGWHLEPGVGQAHLVMVARVASISRLTVAVARLVRGEGYAKFLADLADQAELEGTPLLADVEAVRRRSRGLVK